MSGFSDCLEKIRIRRELTNTQIADLCGVEKTVIHRWFTGQRLPGSWEKIEETIGKLHLSVDEQIQLKKAYERTLVGEEQYEYYQQMIGLMAMIQEEKDEKFKKENEIIGEYQITGLPKCLILENKMEILQCIQNLCAYLSKQKEKHLYLKMQAAGKEILTMVKMFCHRNPDCSVEEIVYMDNELDGSYTYNAKIFQEAISLLMLKNPVEIYYSESDDSDKKFAINWLISDDFFLQFNAQMSYGIMTTEKEWLSFFQDDFKSIKKSCHPIGHKRVNPEEYLGNMNYHGSYLIGIEFMPCFGKCLTEMMMRSHIYDIPGKEELIQAILEGMGGIQETGHAFFLPEGMKTFMETGILEIFPYKIYRPVDQETRCEILERAVSFMEKGVVVQHMLRENRFPDMRGLHIEQVHGKTEKLTFTIRFEEEKKEQIEITEQRILNRFWQFFEYLKESEYVYSEEETLEYMKKQLKEYEKKFEITKNRSN